VSDIIDTEAILLMQRCVCETCVCSDDTSDIITQAAVVVALAMCVHGKRDV
jgi:hypothetical protein